MPAAFGLVIRYVSEPCFIIADDVRVLIYFSLFLTASDDTVD